MTARRVHLSRPSPATIISLIALFVALGGSGYAATVATTKKKAKHHAAPLTSATVRRIIRQQAPGLSVSHAKTAASAVGAQSATNAQNAVNAQNATNANALGGQPPGAYAANSRILTSGLVKLSGTTSAHLITVGNIGINLNCTKNASGTTAVLFAGTGEPNSDLAGTIDPGGSDPIAQVGPSSSFASSDGNTGQARSWDVLAPSGAQVIVTGTVGINGLGTDCFADLTGVL